MDHRFLDNRYEKMQSLIRLNMRFDCAANCLNGLEILPVWEKIPGGLFYVWENLCLEMLRWKSEKIFYLPAVVKVTAAQLTDREIPQSLGNLCRKYQIPEGILQIEIAETDFCEENRKVLEDCIPKLQEQGIGVVLDGFGSGYLSLKILKNFDFDGIKIDIRHLISSLGCMKERVIVESVIQMAAALKIPITAEGIESGEESDFLMKMGCPYQQGAYLYEERSFEKMLPILMEYRDQKRLHISSNTFCKAEKGLEGTAFNPILYEAIVQYLPGPVVVYQVSDKIDIILANQEALRLSDYSLEEYAKFLDQDILRVIPKEDVQKLNRKMEMAWRMDGALNTTFRFLRRDGEERWLTMWANMVGRWMGNPVFLAMLNDVTKQKRREKELKEKAELDMLTGLYNRGTIEAKIRENLEQQRAKGAAGAMFMIDVDNFKKINDTGGHGVGDRALSLIGKKIRTLFRKSDVYGRMGGDEFIVYMNEINSRESVLMKAEQISRELQIEISGSRGKSLPVTCSIGIVISPEHGETFEELFEKADSAVYQAKKEGKNTFVLMGQLAQR